MTVEESVPLQNRYLAKAAARRRAFGTHQTKDRAFAIKVVTAKPSISKPPIPTVEAPKPPEIPKKNNDCGAFVFKTRPRSALIPTIPAKCPVDNAAPVHPELKIRSSNYEESTQEACISVVNDELLGKTELDWAQQISITSDEGHSNETVDSAVQASTHYTEKAAQPELPSGEEKQPTQRQTKASPQSKTKMADNGISSRKSSAGTDVGRNSISGRNVTRSKSAKSRPPQNCETKAKRAQARPPVSKAVTSITTAQSRSPSPDPLQAYLSPNPEPARGSDAYPRSPSPDPLQLPELAARKPKAKNRLTGSETKKRTAKITPTIERPSRGAAPLQQDIEERGRNSAKAQHAPLSENSQTVLPAQTPRVRTRAALRAKGLKPSVKIQWGGETVTKLVEM